MNDTIGWSIKSGVWSYGTVAAKANSSSESNPSESTPKKTTRKRRKAE